MNWGIAQVGDKAQRWRVWKWCQMINNFFQDAGKRLGMKGDVEKSSFPEYSGPVENIIRK